MSNKLVDEQKMNQFGFNKKFVFGAATASYQIEGGRHEGGRTDCIWDAFCDAGKVYKNQNADVACDHYHRYKEDVKLLKKLEVSHYRLSIAWPRIFPQEGKFNQEGMDFYINLLTELNKNNIKPCITLYHWDLPLWVQEKGGWENRENVKYFVEYALKCFEHLDKLCAMWITHNEPWCTSFVSNHLGFHAPGKKDLKTAIVVAHNLLLSHGEVVREYKKRGYKNPIGITLNMNEPIPYTDTQEDKIASSRQEQAFNGWFLCPIFKKCYPSEIQKAYESEIGKFDFIEKDDFDIFSTPIDFLGVNYYNTHHVCADESRLLKYRTVPSTENEEATDMGWRVEPKGLGMLIERLRKDYTDLPIYITENGACYTDTLIGGKVDDKKREKYIIDHLNVIGEQNLKGNNVAGYFVWSLLDNFEWAEGYSRRFGIVYVDYKTLKRTPKKSFYAYRDFIFQQRFFCDFL